MDSLTPTIFLLSDTATVLSQLRQELPTEKATYKVAYITTATEVEDDADTWLTKDRELLHDQTGWQVDEYTITDKSAQQLRAELIGYDILFISGGNVFYLLYQAQRNDFLQLIRDAVASGVIYIGQSAGAILAGPDIYPTFRSEKIAKAPALTDYAGLGLTNTVVLPHWGSEALRTVYFNERLEHAYNETYTYLPLTNNQYAAIAKNYIHIIDVKNS